VLLGAPPRIQRSRNSKKKHLLPWKRAGILIAYTPAGERLRMIFERASRLSKPRFLGAVARRGAFAGAGGIGSRPDTLLTGARHMFERKMLSVMAFVAVMGTAACGGGGEEGAAGEGGATGGEAGATTDVGATGGTGDMGAGTTGTMTDTTGMGAGGTMGGTTDTMSGTTGGTTTGGMTTDTMAGGTTGTTGTGTTPPPNH
jgi:hypothetical protein